jgi:dUTPase
MTLPLINKSNNPFPQHETEFSAGFDIRVNLVNLDQLKALNPELDIRDSENDNVSNGFKIILRPNQQVKLPTGLFLNNELLKELQTFNEKKDEELNVIYTISYNTPVLKLYPRSSTGLKGLEFSNTIPIIDIDYDKEIILLVKYNPPLQTSMTINEVFNRIADSNFDNRTYEINHGDKLAQGCFETVLRFPGMIKDEVRNGGFGSTN